MNNEEKREKESMPGPDENVDNFERFLTKLADHINGAIHNNFDGNFDFYLVITSLQTRGHTCIISNTDNEDVVNALNDELDLLINGSKVYDGKVSLH